MPTSAPQFRPRGAPTRQDVKRESDARRRADTPWRGWYALAIWADPENGIRIVHLRAHPFCVYCLQEGHEVMGTVVNHNPPHKGDWDKFISGPFETCCKRHHDKDVQRRERADEREARRRAELTGGSAE